MDMITDNEIKLKGLEALVSALGEVQAEKFISPGGVTTPPKPGAGEGLTDLW